MPCETREESEHEGFGMSRHFAQEGMVDVHKEFLVNVDDPGSRSQGIPCKTWISLADVHKEFLVKRGWAWQAFTRNSL